MEVNWIQHNSAIFLS